MRKMAYFLLVILSAFQWMHADEPVQHSLFVSPNCVKSSKLGSDYYAYLDKTHRSRDIPIPKIHQSFWPNFCVKHVREDPYGCSAWGNSKTHPVDLELSIYGYSHAHVDVDLVKRLGELIQLIPTDACGCHGGYIRDYSCEQRRCDYAICSSCGQTVIRGVCCIENGDFDENDKEEFGKDYDEPQYFY
jgi:hypothetical protein